MSLLLPGQRQALSNYVTYLMRQFELTDWRVDLGDEHPDNPDAAAEIKATYGRKLATIKLGQGFLDDDLDKIEHYLIHELCHLFSEGIDNVIQNGPEALLGKPAYTILFEQYTVAMEIMTDTLAYVLQDLLGTDKYRALLQALKPALPPPAGAPAADGPPAPEGDR